MQCTPFLIHHSFLKLLIPQLLSLLTGPISLVMPRGVNPNASSNVIIVLGLVYTLVSLLVTGFRLLVRKPSRWGWDDALVVAGNLALIIQCIVLWTREYTATRSSLAANLTTFYMSLLCLYLEDWMARMSILWSIIRIAQDDLTRRRLKITSIIFVLLMIANGVLLVATCESDGSRWHTAAKPPHCFFRTAIPIYRIASGVFADAILVLVPIYILRDLQTAVKLRRRLICIFAASLLMTFACIAQSVVTLVIPGRTQLAISLTEGFISLITSNLTIVVTAVLRLVGASDGLQVNIRQTARPSAIRLPTLTIPSAIRTSRAATAEGRNTGCPDAQAGQVGMNSLSSSGSHSRKSEMENSKVESQVIDSGNPRATRSFLQRWRSLDVDNED